MLLGDLSAPKWKVLSGGKIQVESKDDIRKRLGRSTDDGERRSRRTGLTGCRGWPPTLTWSNARPTAIITRRAVRSAGIVVRQRDTATCPCRSPGQAGVSAWGVTKCPNIHLYHADKHDTCPRRPTGAPQPDP